MSEKDRAGQGVSLESARSCRVSRWVGSKGGRSEGRDRGIQVASATRLKYRRIVRDIVRNVDTDWPPTDTLISRLLAT